MPTDYERYDRVQFEVHELSDKYERLLARVTALENGAPLPADQETNQVPTDAGPNGTSVDTRTQTGSLTEVDPVWVHLEPTQIPELVRAGMPTGARK